MFLSVIGGSGFNLFILILALIILFIIIIKLIKNRGNSYDKLLTLLKADFKKGLAQIEDLDDIYLKQELILEGKKDLAKDTYKHIRDILIDNLFLQELFHEIFNTESNKRKRAALTLVEINTPQSIDYAISLLYDQDQELKDNLILGLAKVDNPKITTTFINYLEVCNDKLTIESLKNAILKRGEESVNQLLELLKNSADSINLNLLIELLAEINDQKAVDPLIDLLYDHSEAEVRVAAARGLGNYKSNKVFKALLYKSEDDNCHVRAQIVKILGEFKREEVLAFLYQMLKDTSGIVRDNAAQALLEFGDLGIQYLILAQDNAIAENEVNRILKTLDTSKLIKLVKKTYQNNELIEETKKVVDFKEKSEETAHKDHKIT